MTTREQAAPAGVEPMLAREGPMPRHPEAWAFEYKWDGVRAMAYLREGRFRMESRNLKEITGRYPDLAPDGSASSLDGFVLDGEIVAPDREGRPSFALLQHRMHVSPGKAGVLASRIPVRYFLFDVLWSGGEPLLTEPWWRRREILEKLVLPSAHWQVPAAHTGEGPAMLRVARRWGLEGLMAKRLDSVYRPGVRSRDWVKIKIIHGQDLLIGGWEPQKNNDRRIGALLMGYHAGSRDQVSTTRDTGLVFAGRVGTGFSDAMHEVLLERLERLRRDESPFGEVVGKETTRFVEPRLVAQIRYRRWPEGQRLQQASFVGLRDDIAPRDVIRERATRRQEEE